MRQLTIGRFFHFPQKIKFTASRESSKNVRHWQDLLSKDLMIAPRTNLSTELPDKLRDLIVREIYVSSPAQVPQGQKNPQSSPRYCGTRE